MVLQRFFKVAAVLGAIAVTVAAIAAHVLKSRLTPDQLSSLNIASMMLLFHALAIMICSNLNHVIFMKRLVSTIKLMLAGTLLFSGSIFLLTVKNLTGIAFFGFVGFLTPIGGFLLIFSWLRLTTIFSVKTD